MKKSAVFSLAALSTLFAVDSVKANTIADWTFETSQPTTTGPITPEIGSGSASFLSTGPTATTISSPTGNGSAHSFSANGWDVGESFQFTVSTLGFTGITISFDETGSNTGPKDFGLFYSVNGGAFVQTGIASPNYSVLANASPNTPWSTATVNAAYTYTYDLSSIFGLNNDASVSFRLVDADTTAITGGTVASGGTDRVDNFVVSGTAIAAPEQTSTFALASLGFSACLAFRRLSVIRS